MTQIVPYKNGNSLSYTEYGDRHGYPVLVQHGLIASISDYHLFERLIAAGIHLICIARPGYGASSPYRMHHLGEWGKIVSVLVDKLELSQFDVLGISSGAPYSYAIGHQLPEKVQRIFILSGTPALYAEHVLALWPYPVNKQARMAELKTLAHELFFSNLSAADLLRQDIQDAMMNHGFGIAQDFKLRCVDWGFKLEEVKANVYMRHSRADNQVPYAAAELTAKLLPHCSLVTTEHDDHFSGEILDNFIQTAMLPHYGRQPG